MSARSLVLVLVLAAAASLCGCVVYDTAPSTHPVPYPSPAPPPVPAPSVEIRFFYDALDPDGDWLWLPPHGWVWAPAAVDPFWRPYSVGHWVWTDWGWTWVSSERWGWATYHYGRWVHAPHHGWVWVPGDVWGPGWVAWRSGPGLVGWAPLPPDVHFRAGVGLDWGGVDIDVAIDLGAWCFLDETRFGDDNALRYAYPVGRNATAVRATKNVTRVRLNGPKIVNEGIDRGEIERATHRPIKERRVIDQPRPALRPATIIGDDVEVYRPAVQEHDRSADPPHGRKPMSPQAPEEVFKNDAAEKNWDRRWNGDWKKLQKVQQRDLPPKSAGTPPAPAVEKQHRDENRDAADNAYDELVVEHERENRKAERAKDAPKPQGKDEKKNQKKDEKKEDKAP